MERLKLASSLKLAQEAGSSVGLVVFTSLLASTALLGPLYLRSIGAAPRFEPARCAPGFAMISARFDPGTHFNIVREKQPGLDWMPDFHIGRFRWNAHSLPDANLIEWAEGRGPRSSLFHTLDYRSSQKVMVVARTESLPPPGSLWQVCGEWEQEPLLKHYNIFYAKEAASHP
jgi:hypothetical protein